MMCLTRVGRLRLKRILVHEFHVTSFQRRLRKYTPQTDHTDLLWLENHSMSMNFSQGQAQPYHTLCYGQFRQLVRVLRVKRMWTLGRKLLVLPPPVPVLTPDRNS